MKFLVDQVLFRLFPGLRIGVIVCEVDNTKYGDDRLEQVIEGLRAEFSHEKPQDHINIRVWREAFTKLGIPASKYYSSTEALLRRVLKGGPFPRINPMVDLYNAISLKYLAPMGGHALSPIEGDIFLGFAGSTEWFTPMDSCEPERVDKGEVVYKDGKEILTRRWVWRQCNKDKVGPETRSVFIPIDILPGLPDALCETIMLDMELSLARNGYGRVTHRDIVSSGNASTTFQV
jgi:DNA/RNA-binding domain of Phe-tRNA-synthetase-like protein